MDIREDGKFEFPVRLPLLEPGCYYLPLSGRDNGATIPYHDRVEGVQVPGDGSLCAAGGNPTPRDCGEQI
jgi:hypothetical protein